MQKCAKIGVKNIQGEKYSDENNQKNLFFGRNYS